MGSYASLAIAGADGTRAGDGDGDGGPAAVDVGTAVARARGWLATVEASLSPYRADSDLSRWRRGDLRLAEASPLLREVIDDVAELSQVTSGGFNPIDPQGRYDPSGYVKGWAVRRAVDGLVADGFADVCLGIGGDLQLIGSPGEALPWRAAVVDPADGRRIVAVVEQPVAGDPLAIATSGIAERGEHIWAALGAPRSGPDANRLASVTVVGPDLGRVDAFATAIWALAQDRPLEQAWDWLPGTGCAALAVTSTGTTHTTSGMPEHLVTAAA